VITFDLDDDAPIFWQKCKTVAVDSRFNVDLPNTHTLQLEFAKDGFSTRYYYFEIIRPGRAPLDVASSATRPVYGANPIESTMHIVLVRRAPTSVNLR
jgi:hypothetical protein